MLYTLKNQYLTVTVSDRGAEMHSILDAFGNQRLWQGDEASWNGRAPVLFPFCGRQWEGKYTVDGKCYDMSIHGFFRRRDALAEQVSDTEIRFTQTHGEDTLEVYPFRFRVVVGYRLEENRIVVTAKIENLDNRPMAYGYGGHPGFCVPLGGGELADYFVEFPRGAVPRATVFDESQAYPAGGTKPFPLTKDNRWQLDDGVFGSESVFLWDTEGEATLATELSERYVKLRYEGFPYLGLWKIPGARYLCMEPWSSLPARSGEVNELYRKEDLVRLEVGESRLHEFSVEIG